MCNTTCKTQFNYIISLRLLGSATGQSQMKVRYLILGKSPSYSNIKTEHLVFYLVNPKRNRIVLPPSFRGKAWKVLSHLLAASTCPFILFQRTLFSFQRIGWNRIGGVVDLDHRVAVHQVPQVCKLPVWQCLRPNVRILQLRNRPSQRFVCNADSDADKIKKHHSKKETSFPNSITNEYRHWFCSTAPFISNSELTISNGDEGGNDMGRIPKT